MIRSALSAMLALSVILTGCQSPEQTSGRQDYPSGPVTMTAGANPGSGFDITIRSVVETLQKEQIVKVPLPVQNRPGGSGADFLATMVEQYKGADDQISVTSLAMMVNELRGKSKYGYDDVTMIARLMTEYFVVVTASGAPYHNLADVMAAIKSDPSHVKVGAAQDDEAPFDLLVLAAGGDPVNHQLLPARAAVTRARRFSTATSASHRRSQRVHRCREVGRPQSARCTGRASGYPALTLRRRESRDSTSPWRTGGASTGRRTCRQAAVAYWQKALGEMVKTPTWKQIAERRQFTTTFMIGDEFATFLAKTQADVKAALEQAAK